MYTERERELQHELRIAQIISRHWYLSVFIYAMIGEAKHEFPRA